MKKRLLIFLLLLMLIPITGCEFLKGNSNDIYYTYPTSDEGPDENYTVPFPEIQGDFKVTFDCNNGYIFESKTNAENKALKPQNPRKIASAFLYWCSDEELQNEFNFNNKITENITLYAKYYLDYAKLNNVVYSSAIKSNVRIECEFYNSSLSSDKSRSLGSGVIVYDDSNYYYCLTNNHVVYNSLRYSKYTVEDCYGNEYNGTLIKNLSTYDLALLRFPKIPDIDIKVIKLAEDNLSIYEAIISMGTPHSLTNTVTYGNILSKSYTFTPPADSIEISNVTFNVLTHTAPIYNGSSGGALLDTNMNLVGINFASSVNSDTNKFNFAYTVPLSNVKEFLALAGINL